VATTLYAHPSVRDDRGRKGIVMTGGLDGNRRDFLGTAVAALAAARFGFSPGSAAAAEPPTGTTGRPLASFPSLREIDAGLLRVSRI
jgi:hypothetical protein